FLVSHFLRLSGRRMGYLISGFGSLSAAVRFGSQTLPQRNRRSFSAYLYMTLPSTGHAGATTGAGCTTTGCTGCTNCTGCAHVGCAHTGTGHAKLIGCWKTAVVQYCPASVCRSHVSSCHASVASRQRLQASI